MEKLLSQSVNHYANSKKVMNPIKDTWFFRLRELKDR